MVEPSGDGTESECSMVPVGPSASAEIENLQSVPRQIRKLPINTVCQKSLDSYLHFSLIYQRPEEKKPPQKKKIK